MTAGQIVNLDIDGRHVAVPYSPGMNVQQVLERASEHTDLAFVARYYGPRLGYKVVMIDGLWDADYRSDDFRNSAEADRYWLIYVNDAEASGGANHLSISGTDRVQLRYQRPRGASTK